MRVLRVGANLSGGGGGCFGRSNGAAVGRVLGDGVLGDRESWQAEQ